MSLSQLVLQNYPLLKSVASKIPVVQRNPELFLNGLFEEDEYLKIFEPHNKGERFHVSLWCANQQVADSVLDDGVLGILGMVFSKRAMCVVYLALVMKHRGRNWDSCVPTFADIIDLFHYMATVDTSTYPVQPKQYAEINVAPVICFVREFCNTTFVLPEVSGKPKCYRCVVIGQAVPNCLICRN
jgi:hypothetical protein